MVKDFEEQYPNNRTEIVKQLGLRETQMALCQFVNPLLHKERSTDMVSLIIAKHQYIGIDQS